MKRHAPHTSNNVYVNRSSTPLRSLSSSTSGFKYAMPPSRTKSVDTRIMVIFVGVLSIAENQTTVIGMDAPPVRKWFRRSLGLTSLAEKRANPIMRPGGAFSAVSTPRFSLLHDTITLRIPESVRPSPHVLFKVDAASRTSFALLPFPFPFHRSDTDHLVLCHHFPCCYDVRSPLNFQEAAQLEPAETPKPA